MTYWIEKRNTEKRTEEAVSGDYIAGYCGGSPAAGKRAAGRKKVDKGTRGMPRLPEAMKDATSCDKPRGSAHTN